MLNNNCLPDLRCIDRSSFTLEPRAENNDESIPTNPFTRTQSLFRKKASQQLHQRQERRVSPVVVCHAQPFHKVNRQELVYDQILDRKEELRHSDDMSFFDSFGKTLDDRHLRIKTEPCQHPHRTTINTEPEGTIKPVTEFFLNLNSLAESNPKTKVVSNRQSKPSYDLLETVKRLHVALEEADEQSRKHLTEEIPEKLLVQLRRITIKLELSNRQNQQNTKSSRHPRLVKERDCLDRNRKVHIEMVKMDHCSPDSNSYRKRKPVKGSGLYALKSRLHLK